MGVFLSPPANVNAFGTLGRAEAATTPVAPAPAGMSFPGVAGVDLPPLGYQGGDLGPVTAVDPGRPLPDTPTAPAPHPRARNAAAPHPLHGPPPAAPML